MRILQSVRIDPIPDFAFEKSTGHQWLIPKRFGRISIFCQQVSESHRTIEIDHRSARSCCRLRRSSTIVIIGLRGAARAQPKSAA